MIFPLVYSATLFSITLASSQPQNCVKDVEQTTVETEKENKNITK